MLDSGVERRAPPKKAGVVSRAITMAGQLVLPSLVLAGAFALAWVCMDDAATDLRFLGDIDPSLAVDDGWLTWGALLLPCVFFVLNLTSRRYGPAIALGATVIVWVGIAVGVGFAMRDGVVLSTSGLPPMPIVVSFVGSMFLGQIVNIYLFDWFRGVPWWKAPFIAALCGGLVFTAALHTASGGLVNGAALARLAVFGGVQLIWASIQLVPTQLLRRAIRPGSGYGGA